MLLEGLLFVIPIPIPSSLAKKGENNIVYVHILCMCAQRQRTRRRPKQYANNEKHVYIVEERVELLINPLLLIRLRYYHFHHCIKRGHYHQRVLA